MLNVVLEPIQLIGETWSQRSGHFTSVTGPITDSAEDPDGKILRRNEVMTQE